MTRDVIITGLGLEVPGLESREVLASSSMEPVTPQPFDAKARLGRKGLLGKDHATRLALSAAKGALEDAGLPAVAKEQPEPGVLGVAVSSNLGNLDTICKVVDTIHETHVRDTSMLDAPNASSNVIASTIAIRFGCRATNLMFCSGGGGGAQALQFAANTIRARRAERMIVVGVEPVNPVTERLMTESAKSWLTELPPSFRLTDGAAAVLLESEEAAAGRGAEAKARILGYGAGADPAASVKSAAEHLQGVGLWLTPGRVYPPVEAAVTEGVEVFESMPEILDLWPKLGEPYGALGLLQCVAGVTWIGRNSADRFCATSGGTFGDTAMSVIFGR